MRPDAKILRNLLLLSMLAFLLVGAAVAGEQIQRQVISSGGGSVVGGGVVMQHSIAQPVAGVVADSGNQLVLCSGYLCGRTTGGWVYLPLIRRNP